jgi:hypothetical protein
LDFPGQGEAGADQLLSAAARFKAWRKHPRSEFDVRS